jgi:hypothetical protein
MQSSEVKMDSQVNFSIPADWLTTAEAASAAPGGAMTKSGMSHLLRTGKVKAVKRANRWWVDPASLAAYEPERGTRARIGKKPE